MTKITAKQKAFLEKYGIPLNKVLDAKGLKTGKYKILMKEQDKLVAIGVTACEKEKHTMRDRSGHCIQCDIDSISYRGRYYVNESIYVAASEEYQLIKVGMGKKVKRRIADINNEKYGKVSDWKVIYSTNCKTTGRVEHEIHTKLKKFNVTKEYCNQGKKTNTYEIFNCSYKDVKLVIDIIKKQPERCFEEEFEIKDAVKLYNFNTIKTSL